MIQLHQFAPAFGVPNPGPFCMKVEGVLRLAGLPYTTVTQPDPRKGPLGKLPFIVDGDQRLADSSRIVDYLRAEYGFDADDGLDASTRAVHRAFIALLEDRLYFALVWLRWIDEHNWPLIRDTYFGSLPVPLRQLVPRIARAQVRRDLHGQGMGRHDHEFIVETARRDWAALSEYLGDAPFFGGEKPALLDVVAVAMLANFVRGVVRSPVRDALAADARLMGYLDRSMKRLFGMTLA